jgi:hypothetical protein
MRIGSLRRAVLVVVVVLGVLPGRGRASGTPAQRCAAAKIRAAGKKAACLLALDAKTAGGAAANPTKLQRCRDHLSDPVRGAFAKAEGRGGCATGGDAATVEAAIDGFVDSATAALDVGTPSACQRAKIAAVGKKAKCLSGLQAKIAGGSDVDPARLQSCGDRMTSAFQKAEAGGGCGTTGDAGTLETMVDQLVDAIVADEPTSVSCAMVGCPSPLACDTGQGACWQPPADSRFQYQLQAATTGGGTCAFSATGGINVGISAPPFGGGAAVSPAVYDIDLLTDPVCAAGGSNDVENGPAVTAIHGAGAHALCYVDAGTDEPFRPDHPAYVAFDASCGGCLLGKPVGGFREERWLNINDDQGQRAFVLGQVATRVDRCKDAGFDAVEFDNVDAYTNDTGLPLSAASQLLFDTALANLAHARGLTVGLKNALDQIPELLPYFDFSIDEQCQQFDECALLDPFLMASRPVFQVEYNVGTGTFCPPANTAGRNAIMKSVDLFDVPWTPCR